jgi:phosphoribosylformylglycinamidine synthase
VKTEAPAPLAGTFESKNIAADLVTLMGSPDLASRRWIWEQYDHMVGADTVQRPGGDAAVVRVHGTQKGLAISTDCTPRYCYADPFEGGKQAIAECYRNLSAVGALPLATTDCMNFGNPQRPEIMGQFVGCIEGMAEACAALDFPIVSGNVSLYNETKGEDGTGSAILPTPAIGGVGLLADWEKSATIAFKAEGEEVFLLCHSHSHLGQSVWLREIAGLDGRNAGPAPFVDLKAEKAAGELVRGLIADGLVTAVHDCSDGGVAVAVAEMALASNIGVTVPVAANAPAPTGLLFGEDQGRYIVTTTDPEALRKRAEAAGVNCIGVGVTGGDAVAFDLIERGGVSSVTLADLRRAHEGFFPTLMGADAALA